MPTKSFHTLDLSRRALLRGATLAGGAAALAAGLGSRALADNRISQAAANYQPTPKGGQRCNVCSQWAYPNSCKVVVGSVEPTGWCSLFAPKW